MSGKDTAGTSLAEALGAEFLSSGAIIRRMEAETAQSYSASGALIPSDLFYDWVLPYFSHQDLVGKPLVLSSIGRWSGEENSVMTAADQGDHPIRVAILLDLDEKVVLERWQAAHAAGHRVASAPRQDDASLEIFEARIREFREKTEPVLQHYAELGLLVKVSADAPREEVFARLVAALVTFAKKN